MPTLRHPESRFQRAVYPDLAASGRRSRPVDRHGFCRQWTTFEKRAVNTAADGSVPFLGHAATFDSRTLIGDLRWGFYEEIAPGAFAKTIQEADVRFLFNHDPSLILGRTKSGTLRLAEDAQGLAVDADMGPYSWAADVAVGLNRGDLTQMSFAFDPIKWERDEDPNGVPIYRLTEVRLWDVAVVTYPAYEDTDAELGETTEAREVDSVARSLESVAQALRAGDLDKESVARALSWPADTIGNVEPGTSTRNNAPPVNATDVDLIRSHDEHRHRLLSEFIA